jgi:ribosome-associated heat shock protein Hsp15
MEKTGSEKTDPRIDKWLWAVRLFKTRNQSAEACRKGRVLIDGQAVKPSRHVREGDIISLRRPPAVLTYRVRGLVENRQPAREVNNYLEDLTPGEERQKALHHNIGVFSRRDRGSGRPTKKERRTIDKLKGPDN